MAKYGYYSSYNNLEGVEEVKAVLNIKCVVYGYIYMYMVVYVFTYMYLCFIINGMYVYIYLYIYNFYIVVFN